MPYPTSDGERDPDGDGGPAGSVVVRVPGLEGSDRHRIGRYAAPRWASAMPTSEPAKIAARPLGEAEGRRPGRGDQHCDDEAPGAAEHAAAVGAAKGGGDGGARLVVELQVVRRRELLGRRSVAPEEERAERDDDSDDDGQLTCTEVHAHADRRYAAKSNMSIL